MNCPGARLQASIVIPNEDEESGLPAQREMAKRSILRGSKSGKIKTLGLYEHKE